MDKPYQINLDKLRRTVRLIDAARAKRRRERAETLSAEERAWFRPAAGDRQVSW